MNPTMQAVTASRSVDLARITCGVTEHIASIYKHDLPAEVTRAIGDAVAIALGLAVGAIRDETAELCFEAAFRLILGSELGPAVLGDALGTATEPNTKLAPSVSRAVVSKWVCKVRRNAGLPVNVAKGIGRGHKPGWRARAAAKNSNKPEARPGLPVE